MPYRFMPVSNVDFKGSMNQINRNFQQLDQEAVTKQFKGPDGSSLTMGRTGQNTFGIIAENTDGSKIGMGQIPGTNEFGFFSVDQNDALVAKWVSGTIFVYDINTGKNISQFGIMPDNSVALAIAKVGFDVADAFN